MMVDDGVAVGQWGPVDRKWPCYSIRRGFLSALCGIAVAEGQIDLQKSLDQLGIDDLPPSLTAQEKQASVLDLLKNRSGIYHPATSDTAETKAHRPKRGSHPPGSFWFANTWDVNALGTIYEQAARWSVFAGFERLIAFPLEMQDFDVAHDTRIFPRADFIPSSGLLSDEFTRSGAIWSPLSAARSLDR